ncbi:MAG: RNA polymerase subunit sigma-24 [Acidobacteria bacterium]|nr:MAG: RNA polymerase subunit sigma-24 [Acidobacteriota bacterium]
MQRMEESDADALALARAGDSEGFRVLVERHSRAVFRLAYRMTGNEHDAEDVVQEAFLRAYRRLDQYDQRARFSSWLYRIAANCAFDLLRARRRRDEDPWPEGTEATPADFPATDPAPDRLVMSAEVKQRVTVAMSRMSAQEKAAFVLRHFEGMSIAEIGQALDLEASAAKQSVLRAVRKVRQVLAPALGVAQ